MALINQIEVVFFIPIPILNHFGPTIPEGEILEVHPGPSFDNENPSIRTFFVNNLMQQVQKSGFASA
jgi:hypothetical protein